MQTHATHTVVIETKKTTDPQAHFLIVCFLLVNKPIHRFIGNFSLLASFSFLQDFKQTNVFA